LEVAATAGAWPADLAPSAGKLAQARGAWQTQLDEALKAAQVHAAESLRRGAELIAAVQKEVAPMLAKNRFDAATELLDAKARDAALADARPLIEQEKADVAAVVALREAAVQKL